MIIEPERSGKMYRMFASRLSLERNMVQMEETFICNTGIPST